MGTNHKLSPSQGWDGSPVYVDNVPTSFSSFNVAVPVLGRYILRYRHSPN